MIEIVEKALGEAKSALSDLLANKEQIKHISDAGILLAQCFQKQGKAISCGNGGSHCDAMHFAEELTGRFRSDRAPFAALAVSDPSHLSCVANDYGFEFVFSRFVEAHGRPGDVLLGISTSGTSKNILAAVEAAKARQMKVITLTGRPQSAIGLKADIDICTPGGKFADRVQELHIKVIHSLIELVEHYASK